MLCVSSTRRRFCMVLSLSSNAARPGLTEKSVCGGPDLVLCLLHYRIVLVLHKISYLSSSLMLPIFLTILLLVILSRLLRIICYIAKGTMGELIVMVQADLTYIFGGKGSRRNLGGQRVYNLLIPMWAALLNLIEPSSKSKFLDCVYLGMKQGGAKFLAIRQEN